MSDDNVNTGRAELGEAPIGRLLVKMSLPATVAMMVNALYNLVDTIYIGRGVGTEGIGGLALALPVQMIIMAFGMAIGQGAASIVSRALGAEDDRRARRAAGNAFALSFVLGLLTLVLGTLLLEPLLGLLGADFPIQKNHARDYLRIILIGAPFIAMAMVGNNLLRAEGKARVAMTVMLIGALSNILLDPLFIFVFDMGVAGAAWATVIGQFLAFPYSSRFFILRNSLAQVRPKPGIPDGRIMGEIASLGLPALVRQTGQSVVAILVNNLLGEYGGPIYISAYGVVNRLIMFLFMPLFGLIQGFQPIAGFNYGARNYGRMRQTVRLTMVATSAYTTAGIALPMPFPGFFAGIFTPDANLIATVALVIRYVVAVFPLLGIQIVGGTYFMVVGKPVPSLILNLSRQFLILIPLLILLPPLFGTTGLLLSFPAADLLATIITGVWFLAELRHLKRKELSVEGD